MSWRVVVVSNRCKLESKLGYLICRGEETKKVFIKEISTLIIESTAVSITAALLVELVEAKVNIVFCDEKHNPLSQVLALNGRHNGSGVFRRQLTWTDERKAQVWARIVELKIYQQYRFLTELQDERAQLLQGYLLEVEAGDRTNREGHSAKVYFDSLFGLRFRRGDDNFINGALNYGYAVLLSAFAREVVADGYDLRLGIFHCNEFNSYNLACDLMEPFRIAVDRLVFDTKEEPLDADYKHRICNVLNLPVKIAGKGVPLVDAVGMYVKSVFSALGNGEINGIFSYEF